MVPLSFNKEIALNHPKKTLNQTLIYIIMKQKLLKTMLLLCALVVGGATSVWADPVTLFHETFGNNTGSARDWSDSYSVKSGVSTVYSGITGYTVSNAKQTKNTNGSTASGLNQVTAGTDAYIIIGPLNVASYSSLTLTYQWKAASIKGTYTTTAYYATSSGGSYTEVSGTGTGATTFVERSYSLPAAAQVSTLYLKIVWNTSNTQAIIDEVNLAGTASAPAYTITAQSNNNEYGTVSLSGSVITGSPKSGYRYASPAYSITSGSATVSQDGNAFTVTPSSNCTVQINFEAIPTHTATFSVNGITTSDSFYEGQTITFPSDPSSIAGKTFVGWVTSTIVGTTDDEPEFVSSATMSSSDITYYAVFAAAEAGDPVETKTQTLQYDTWTYSGTTTDKSSYRLFGNSSYIQSAAFDLSKLSKVIVYGGTFGGGSYNSLTIGDGTNTWKSVTVTGASQTGENTYTDGTTLSGTKALYITATAGDGSNNGLRISKVEIYTNEPSVTYSAYCTSIDVTTVETPEISPAGGAVASGTEVTITCSTDGASIYYTTDGTTPTSSSTAYNPASKPTITAAQTIKAIAVKDGLEDSEVASASYTIAVPCETPTFSLDEGEYAKGTTVTISTGTADATIYYTTDGSTPTTSSLIYSSAITINAATTIKAIAVKDGYLNSAVASASYTVIDYVTLPFSWAGGTSSALTATTGVTANELGTDYADSNAPYRIKMDNANDYIQIKTNAQPVQVLVGVKMIGGATTSKIKVQESSDGSSFTDVEEFTISGKQNDILNFKTSNSFKSSTRYVKIIKSVHATGGNIGVGPIMITDFDGLNVTLNASGYATFASTYPLDFSDDSEFSAWQVTAASSGTGVLTFSQITGTVAAGTGVLLKGTASSSINIPVAISGSFDVDDNLLTGITTATAIDADTYYGLSGNTFKKVNAGTVPAGKALLPASEVSTGVKAFKFVFEGEDDADGINAVNGEGVKVNGPVYDLQGRRVQNPSKGLYIVNGKKVLY